MPGFVTTICSDAQKVYIPRDVHKNEMTPLEGIIDMTRGQNRFFSAKSTQLTLLKYTTTSRRRYLTRRTRRTCRLFFQSITKFLKIAGILGTIPCARRRRDRHLLDGLECGGPTVKPPFGTPSFGTPSYGTPPLRGPTPKEPRRSDRAHEWDPP